MTRLRAMSYNVRYDNRNDHHDAWYVRRDGVADLVRFHRPDVVGFQEPLAEQREDLGDRLPGYEFVGRGRRGDGEGEGCPVAVRTDRWDVVDDGTFWLSETPAEPSTAWDASYPRIATWARLTLRRDGTDDASIGGIDDGPADDDPADGASTDTSLIVMNTHLDHVGVRARRESARLLRDRAADLATIAGPEGGAKGGESGARAQARTPVVLVGDFNCTPGSEPHRILTALDGTDAGRDGTDAGRDETDEDRDGTDAGRDETDEDRDGGAALRDAARDATVRHGPATSLTDFANLIDGRRIDHVLVSPAVDVEAFATLADRDDRGRYPSDHLPVLARLSL
ncbi:endonuclease/exonuclease/phosphatase [Halorubrum sp. JWXQ-INN 858]|uniref:endonuclease/exonuclease/phosphatase family protein n=1 Tax=Halorubrum sp. JWXQ-INN 858 TaxID=2690782 RepID=UPI00135B6ABC|nr:endonuclease/exonuclease/phosphatase family protein [Halorubrum sp. JWXQ-INN 858]MWV65847.1 endonuclease/exonuclease/phosphatase [Halorubrum sp. JWXQ-INN 858]